MTGLALNCEIPHYAKFDRKNYPYPDLMKGYQISQYDLPLAVNGCLEIKVGDKRKPIRITRVHLEEDVAKLQHFPSSSNESYSLVDVNRSGVPLMETVSEPDLRSAEEARTYLVTLHSIMQYLGVSTANMQDGSFRCDANISIHPKNSTKYGTRTEVKNMNSFRSVHLAVSHEIERQKRVLEDGGHVTQETRGWIEHRNITVSQRSKEHAHDYRFFPEPDLPPLLIDPKWIEDIRSKLPELAQARQDRLMQQYGLPEYDAGLLTSSRDIADYFETAVAAKRISGTAQAKLAKKVSNWMLGDLSRLINLQNGNFADIMVTPDDLIELIDLIDAGTLNTTLAKIVLEEAFQTGQAPGNIVNEKGYTQIDDSSIIDSAVDQALEANSEAVADFLNGKETAARFLVGQVMKFTGGKANPELVNQLVNAALDARKQSGLNPR
jgi:aspartyl-tRNA(Asn)/glutamyl-tRNA(Gln) amidotransferase subunit B